MSGSIEIVAAAELLSAAAFGVSLAETRGDSRRPAVDLARCACVAAARGRGVTWHALADALSALRGRPVSVGGLRKLALRWSAAARPAIPSAFSRALVDIYESIVGGIALRISPLAA